MTELHDTFCILAWGPCRGAAIEIDKFYISLTNGQIHLFSASCHTKMKENMLNI